MANSYLSSHKRTDDPPPMRFTKRDKQIVLAVHRFRLLSSQQVEALYFPSAPGKPHSRRSACQRRLQLLYHHQFLGRLPRPLILGEGRPPFVYALDKVGADFVAARMGIDRDAVGWKPKDNQLGPQFLEHNLAINDVRVVLTCLMRNAKWDILTWIDDMDFRSSEWKDRVPFRTRGASRIRTYPDGYFVIRFPQREQPAHFFLEVDRGTMTNSRWKKKIEAYTHFRANNLSQKYFGTQNFRVLTVTTSRQRLKNLKSATERAGGGLFFWLTTEANIDIWQPQKLLQPVWVAAGSKDVVSLF